MIRILVMDIMDSINREYTKGVASLYNRGVLRTLSMLIKKMYKVLLRKDVINDVDDNYDSINGVDTIGIMYPTKDHVAGNNWKYGNKYEGVDIKIFNRSIKDLGLSYDKYVFIDFGSGKGRAVFLAATFPFKKVIGVEYCRELDVIAQHNLRICNRDELACKDINFFCMDALEYSLPDEPLFLFINNSFGPKVMKELIRNLDKHYQKFKKPIVVIYFTAECANLWDKLSYLKRVSPISDRSFIKNKFVRATKHVVWVSSNN